MIHLFFKALGRLSLDAAKRRADLIGSVWYRLDRKHRKVALDNLTRAFGNEKTSLEINHLAKRIFKNLAIIPFEIGWSLRLTREDVDRFVRIEGAENYQNALAKGRGVFVLTAHTGNWELLTIAAAILEIKFNVLYRPLDWKALDRFFVHIRTRLGNDVIPKDGSVLRILKCLKRGEAVAMLMDQNVGSHRGVFVDFFGHIACTNKAMAYLTTKLEVPVVPVFIAREKNGFVAECGPELPLIRTGSRIKDIDENTQQYNHAIEAFIRRYPDQWLWVHRRWKTKGYEPWPRVKSDR